jgi:hypothetical protein
MTAPLLLAAISAAILAQIAIGLGVAFWRLQRAEPGTHPIGGDAIATTGTGAGAAWHDFRVERTTFEDRAKTQRSSSVTAKAF